MLRTWIKTQWKIPPPYQHVRAMLNVYVYSMDCLDVCGECVDSVEYIGMYIVSKCVWENMSAGKYVFKGS